jgi:CRISPR system Cascade subunit CasB
LANNDFIEYLQSLQDRRERKAVATLRHSLAFVPGTYPPAFPYVERFVSTEAHERDGRRLALYAVAGLFALHPLQQERSFSRAFGELMAGRNSASIEQRFVALLSADSDNVVTYMRQAVSLLKADSQGFDYAGLLDDLGRWMNPFLDPERRDLIRQRWARDFYRSNQAAPDPAVKATDKT